MSVPGRARGYSLPYLLEFSMNVFAWLLAAIGPLVIRAIVALGFSVVTYAGVMVLLNQLISSAQSSWASLPASVIQLCTLAGIPQALGILVGAYAARIGVWASMNASKFVLKS